MWKLSVIDDILLDYEKEFKFECKEQNTSENTFCLSLVVH